MKNMKKKIIFYVFLVFLSLTFSWIITLLIQKLLANCKCVQSEPPVCDCSYFGQRVSKNFVFILISVNSLICGVVFFLVSKHLKYI